MTRCRQVRIYKNIVNTFNRININHLIVINNRMISISRIILKMLLQKVKLYKFLIFVNKK